MQRSILQNVIRMQERKLQATNNLLNFLGKQLKIQNICLKYKDLTKTKEFGGNIIRFFHCIHKIIELGS